MPTYKNISNKTQVVRNFTFSPLEEKQVPFYIYDNVNFKKTSENPIFSPITFSKKLTSGQTLKIEDHLDKIQDANQIRLAAVNPAFVSFNNDSNQCLITEHPEYIRPVSIIDSIKCESGEVNVEFWRPANWRN